MIISVIVPVYKTEPYLRKCVESILGQTYKNIECILVDDGSPDNCGAICDEYAKKDRRVRVIHKENGGLSDARNAGIDASTGDYLMFVDSDDYIDPETAEKLLKALRENDAEMSLCRPAFVNEADEELYPKEKQLVLTSEVISGIEAISRYYENREWYFFIVCAKLYKQELFDDIRFPKGKLHEDEFVAHRLLGKCRKIACISDKFYRYVQRPGSIMHTQSARSQLCAAQAFVDRAVYVYRLGMNEYAGQFYGRAAKWTGESYCTGNDTLITSESEEALRMLRDNSYLQKYCSLKEKIRAKLCCYSPRVYQNLLTIKRLICRPQE